MVRHQGAITLWLSLAAVTTATALVSFGALRSLPPARFTGRLIDVLPTPAQLPGWTITQDEIATTPEMQRAVSELLNYDDAVAVTYRRGAERVSVYLAHWRPGKMSPRLIAGHTPDVCWVGGGWQVIQKHENNALRTASGRGIPPAQDRLMRFHGADERVLFWHFSGGRAIRYTDALPPWHAWLTDLFVRGVEQRAEQVFLRISAPATVVLESSNLLPALIDNLTERRLMPEVNASRAKSDSD